MYRFVTASEYLSNRGKLEAYGLYTLMLVIEIKFILMYNLPYLIPEQDLRPMSINVTVVKLSATTHS